jgi:hypothetical protein
VTSCSGGPKPALANAGARWKLLTSASFSVCHRRGAAIGSAPRLSPPHFGPLRGRLGGPPAVEFWLVPLIGALVAGLVYKVVFEKEEEARPAVTGR